MTERLRQEAETLARSNEITTEEALSPEEMRQALHELRVHQIELEMQNEELRRTQMELDAARARYFDLYDLAPVGYCTVSEQGLILEANLTAATQLGMTRGEMVRQPWTRFVHHEDQDTYYRQRRQLFATAAPTTFELRMVEKGGGVVWTQLTATLAPGAKGAAVCRLVMQDVRKRKVEEQFRENVERIIQHDIKSPLINLYSLAKMITGGTSTTELMQAFPQIMLGIRQVIHIIDAAEPLRLMERGEYTPPKTQIRLLPVLYSVKDSLAVLSSQRNVQIVLPEAPDVACPAGPLFGGEEFLIEDMFANLVKNAVEASPEGGVVTLACKLDQTFLHMAIHNLGAVPESVRERFFEKYASAGKPYGTGLGTYSAQLIAKAHGGRIFFTSSEAEGTTVTVVFPVAPTTEF